MNMEIAKRILESMRLICMVSGGDNLSIAQLALLADAQENLVQAIKMTKQ